MPSQIAKLFIPRFMVNSRASLERHHHGFNALWEFSIKNILHERVFHTRYGIIMGFSFGYFGKSRINFEIPFEFECRERFSIKEWKGCAFLGFGIVSYILHAVDYPNCSNFLKLDLRSGVT